MELHVWCSVVAWQCGYRERFPNRGSWELLSIFQLLKGPINIHVWHILMVLHIWYAMNMPSCAYKTITWPHKGYRASGSKTACTFACLLGMFCIRYVGDIKSGFYLTSKRAPIDGVGELIRSSQMTAHTIFSPSWF